MSTVESLDEWETANGVTALQESLQEVALNDAQRIRNVMTSTGVGRLETVYPDYVELALHGFDKAYDPYKDLVMPNAGRKNTKPLFGIQICLLDPEGQRRIGDSKISESSMYSYPVGVEYVVKPYEESLFSLLSLRFVLQPNTNTVLNGNDISLRTPTADDLSYLRIMLQDASHGM